jgi:hypothetical protein
MNGAKVAESHRKLEVQRYVSRGLTNQDIHNEDIPMAYWPATRRLASTRWRLMKRREVQSVIELTAFSPAPHPID